MKKAIEILLASLLCLAALWAGGGTEEELVLYTWANMFPQEVLDGFEKETGIKVVYANFDFNENMLEKVSRDKEARYDIVVTDDYMIDIMRRKGLIEKLDKSLIPSFGDINSFYQGYFFDPDNEYVVPYGAGIPLIVYDPEATGFEIEGYKDLWDPRLADSLVLVANYRVVNAVPLLAMGESMNTEDLEAIDKAGRMLEDLAPNIRMLKDDEGQSAILNGEAKAGFLYTGQVTDALRTDPSLKAVFPKEGIGFGIQGAVVLKGAPHAANAHRFLQYLLRPEVSAACFDYIGYYCTTRTADPLVDPLLIIPEGLKGEIMQDVSEAANERLIQNFMRFQQAIQ